MIVTKIGYLRGEGGSWVPAASPDQLEKAVHDNLEHLGLGSLDIVDLCPGGPDDASLEGSPATLADPRRQGLVRHVGLGNASHARIARGVGKPPTSSASKIATTSCTGATTR